MLCILLSEHGADVYAINFSFVIIATAKRDLYNASATFETKETNNILIKI